jgi:hypothetical protein
VGAQRRSRVACAARPSRSPGRVAAAGRLGLTDGSPTAGGC